jgi:very-short-patch-repair endonuclease
VAQIREWAKDLIDLSRRNRSIYYRPLKRGTLEFVSPSSVELYSLLMGGDELSVYIPPPPEADEPWTLAELLARARSTELVSNRTSGTEVLGCLKNLFRAASADLMDRGVQTMYACFGMLEWTDDVQGASLVRSPLVFVPVVLAREGASDSYSLHRSDEDVVLNPSLDVLLTEQLGLSLRPDDVELQDGDNLASILNHVREQIVDRPDWRVADAAVLKRATFHKEAMYRDLLDNIDEISEHDVVRSLCGVSDGDAGGETELPSEFTIDEDAPPEDRSLILDADASQRCAVEAALRGASFVMDGPPGTGKSQTISNTIAQLLSEGRSVLFVSEKAAALEVVASRLSAHGLQDFLLELHSHKASRKEVVDELYRALTSRPEVHPRMSQTHRRKARRVRQQLSSYAVAVNEEREPLGRSLDWVAGRLSQLAHVAKVATPSTIDRDLTAEQSVELQERFEALARLWAPVDDAEFAWEGVAGDRLSATEEAGLARELDTAIGVLGELEDAAGELAFHLGMPAPPAPDDVRTLVRLVDHIRRQPFTERHWWEADVHPLAERVETLVGSTSAQEDDVSALAALYGPAWAELPPEGASELEGAIATMAALSPPVAIPEALATEGLDAAVAAVAALRTELEKDDDFHGVTQALGLHDRSRTVGEMIDLAAIASRADEVVRPERAWTNPAVLRQVQAAVELLGPAVADYRTRHDDVREVFTEAVYDLDLETLSARISHAKGLAKLGSVYRAARKEVAGVSRTGKAGKEVLEALPRALEAQRSRFQLDGLEEQHHQLLGGHYRQYDTNVGAVEQAVSLLTDALKALGDEYDADSVAHLFAGDGPADHHLGQRALALKERLEAVLRVIGNAVPGSPNLAHATLDDALAWAETAHGALSRVGQLVARAVRLRGEHVTRSALSADLERRASVAQRLLELQQSQEDDRDLIGSAYAGFETVWSEIVEGVAWVSELQRILDGPALPAVASKLHQREELPRSDEVADLVEAWDKWVQQLLGRFDEESQSARLDQLSGTFESVGYELRHLQDRIQDARVWVDYVRTSRELEEDGWHATLSECRNLRVSSSELAATLEHAMYAAWFDDVEANDDRLSALRSSDRDALVAEFRRLDKQLLQDASEGVVEGCNLARPKVALGAANVIEREANKKRRHMPVRRLLAETLEIATALKPCFMMSPLSVSQFLPPTHKFDVVIFDEASQIRPADAINCIYRGRQLIVAGDDRQLPPTSFFDAHIGEDDDSYEEDAFDEFESILGLCKGTEIMRSLPLRWHYRSLHESLITFSNYKFYDGNLVTYPGAVDADQSLGIEHFLVDGVYRRGGRRDNPAEAEFVAQRVLHHAQAHPHLSVGVVALSTAQAEAIDNAMDGLRRDHPEMETYFEESRLDGFFVKNLETVQGDERDIILLSIGYGPDEVGKFTMNFGPVNRSGGWRRLNVAITRARRRVELISSFSAADMRTGESRSEGLAALQAYVDYSARGLAALAVDLSQSEGDAESPLEESILSVLRSWGHEVVPQLGAAGYRIDMAIRDPEQPGRFLLAVEADGAAYHSSRAARDRDRLRQEVLEGLGWRLHRIWGPSWYRDREAELVRLREAIDRAKHGDTARTRTDDSPSSSNQSRVRSAIDFDLDRAPEWATTYTSCRLRMSAVGRAHDPNNTAALRKAVQAVIEAESPVHLDIIGRRIADHWGHNLTRTTRREVESTVLWLEREVEVTLSGDFAWFGEDFDVRVPSSDDDATRRDIQHIPPEELQEAVHRLLVDARSCSGDALLQAVKDLFGFRRMGPHIAEALETALGRLIKEGWIERSGDQLRAVQE